MERFAGLHPVTQALLGTLFTWGFTALGAVGVFFFKTIKKTVLNSMLGFASGVMIAASFWSLLAPAIEMSEEMGLISWLPPALGFLAGGAFLWGVDKTLPHLHSGMKREDAEGIKTSWQRSVLLVLAITLHNIPEGISVAVPIFYATGSRRKAFAYSVLSGLAEPVGAAIAYIALRLITGAEGGVMPPQVMGILFGGVAGVMVYISLDELLPTSRAYGKGHDSLLGLVGGMIVMAISLLIMM